MNTEGLSNPLPKMSALRLSQTHCTHGLLRTVCFFFASSFMGFSFLVGSLAVSVVTKNNQGRTSILDSQKLLLLLLHASTVRGHFSAGALLETGAGVMRHMRDKVQRTFSNAACTGVCTQI